MTARRHQLAVRELDALVRQFGYLLNTLEERAAAERDAADHRESIAERADVIVRLDVDLDAVAALLEGHPAQLWRDNESEIRSYLTLKD